jgi:signal peptidase II
MEESSEETAASVVNVPFVKEKKIITSAAIILGADQATKQIVIKTIEHNSEGVVVVEGFLKFVNWHNTGAAWSMFQDSSLPLAILSLVALIALIRFRHQFEIETSTGKIAIGMMIGGILGNMIDRIVHHHVIDFVRFNINRRGGGELGYPAFNIADVGICVGVGLLFVLTWREQKREETGGNAKKGS